jgi:nucleoside-diphosphate-sugar epimerase
MRKVLITGGVGFVGYHLANILLENDYRIDLLDNFSRGVNDSQITALAKNERVNLINADLLLPNVQNKLNKDYSYIYHFAAVIGVQHVLKSPYDVLDKNIRLLQNTLEIANHQKNLTRFIFASTSEIYAGTLNYYGLEFPTPETTPLTINSLNEARTSYMLSKIYGEVMCLHSDLPVTIIRPHNFYGPRMGLSHVIPELMKKVVGINSGKLDVFSVNHRRTFCYIADAVEMIQLLAESDRSIGETYNVGNDDEETTMGDLAKKIINLIGEDIDINPMPATHGSPERRCPSIAKLKDAIPYTKQYPLEKGLQETFDWYNKNIFSGKEVSAV